LGRTSVCAEKWEFESTFIGLVMIKRNHPEEDLSSYLEKKQEAARERLFSAIN